MDLWYDEQLDALAGADASHAEGTLRVVAEGHVLGEGERREGRRRLWDVHADRVHLVVEGEALRERESGLLESHHSPPIAEKDQLLPVVVNKDAAAYVT